MKWIKYPGFHEIRGDPQCGKTTYAILQAVGRDKVAWVSAPLDDPEGLFHCLDWHPDIYMQVGRVGQAFRNMQELQAAYDFIILDSLAGLMPDHPDGLNIAGDVERAWFQPEVPILIINQNRYPNAPGGSLWRGALVSSRFVMSICQCPLVTWIMNPMECLIWAPGGGPIIKPLSEGDLLWHTDLFAERAGIFAQKCPDEQHGGVTW